MPPTLSFALLLLLLPLSTPLNVSALYPHLPLSQSGNILSRLTTSTTLRPTGVRLMAAVNAPEGGYDYVVVGGGSGGIASARRAATYGAKVALVS